MADGDPLTPAGWPRPVVDGMPIPWVSSPVSLGEMHPARRNACASGAICQVCPLFDSSDCEVMDWPAWADWRLAQ